MEILGEKVLKYSEKAASILPDEQVSAVSGKKRDFFVSMENGKFLGMVAEASLIAASPTEKVRNVSFVPPTLSTSSTVLDAISLFASSGMPLLPIVDKGKLVGALLVSAILQRLDFSGVEISSVLNKHTYSVGETTPVSDVREIMQRGRLSRVFVTDSHGNLVGVVTNSSLLSKPSYFKRDWRRVAEVMEHSVIHVSAKDNLKKAVEKLSKHGLRAIPVVEESGKLFGSISTVALLKAYLALRAPTEEGVEIEISGLSGMESFERAALNSIVFGQVKKFANSLGPSALKLVFKKAGSGFEVTVSAKPKRGKSHVVSGSGFDSISAASQALRTLEKVVKYGQH